MKKLMATTTAFAALTASIPASAAIIVHTDRSAFTAATGANTIETFTDTFHFPLISGILNSNTSGPNNLQPGDILAGVTYSTEVFSGQGNFFNIDAGGGFTGGFLDSITGADPRRTLTTTFDALQNGFGFDTNGLMGNFTVDIFGAGDVALGSFSFNEANGLEFFGFESTGQDISYALIAGDSSVFNFALDNFTFDGRLVNGAVPEPATWAFMIIGFGAIGGAMRRQRKTTVKVSYT